MSKNERGGRTIPQMLGRQETELTRESSFVMDGDRSTPGSDGSRSYDDSGSYVSGDTRSDAYTSQGSGSDFTGSEYTDNSYTGSEDDYTDESDGGHHGNGRQSSAPSNRISEEPWSGDDSGRRGGYHRSDHRNSMHKYHTSPDIDVSSHRTITIYRNGDMHFAGQNFVVGPQFKSFDYLLDQITLRIKSPWGAVRRLYNMDTGKPVRKLDDIENGETYVASKLEKYKRADYHAIVDWNTKNRHYEAPDLSKMKYKQRAVEGRNMVEHPLTLYILANRDLDGVVTKVVLKQRDRTSFKHVLDIITQKLGFQKIQSTTQRLIDLETSDHVTDLPGLRHGAFYVAIDKVDTIRMPPFRINSARQLVPIRRKRGKKVKNMPIMHDGPIRGRVDVGDKRVEQREARGIVSDVGKVRQRKGRRRLPEELPPVKQPFPRMLTIVQPPETMHYQRVKVGRSVEDRASWGIVHEYLDEITSSLVEEVLQEYQKALYMLLNNIVIMRTTAKKDFSSMSQLPPIQDTPEPGADRGALSKARSPKPSGRASSETDTYEHDKHIEDFLAYINEPDMDIFSSRASLSPAQTLLKERFTEAMVAAVDGKLTHWEDDPKTLIALIIMLDQIPRRVYTGTANAYAGDAAARAAINRAINDTEIIQQIAPAHMLYVCIALSHQESMDEQDLWKRIWKDIERTFPKMDVDHVAQQFERNRQTIEKFGRFPERNEVLGRTNTAQEAEWLEQQRTPAAAKAFARMSTDLSGAAEPAAMPTRGSRKKRNWFGANRTLMRKGAPSTKR